MTLLAYASTAASSFGRRRSSRSRGFRRVECSGPRHARRHSSPYPPRSTPPYCSTRLCTPAAQKYRLRCGRTISPTPSALHHHPYRSRPPRRASTVSGRRSRWGQHGPTRRGEGIGESVRARSHNSVELLRPYITTPGLDVRTHETTLYTSIVRVDDNMIINFHIYGSPARHNPVMIFSRQQEPRLWATFERAFTRVWDDARPLASPANPPL